MINILNYDSQYTELVTLNFTKYSEDYCYVKDSYYHNTRTILPSIFNLFIDASYQVPTRYIDHDRSMKSTIVNPNSLYPIAVRYVTTDNVYVIERPPFKLSVDFKNSRAAHNSPKVEPVEIWIPWTVMVLPWNQVVNGDPSNLRLYFNDGPIQSLDDCVVAPYLPNSYSDGRICWSHSFNELLTQLNVSEPNTVDVNYLYSSILNDYLMGGWNTDLNFHYRYLQYRDSHTFNAQLASNEYPMISLFVDTLKTNLDFSNKVRSILESKFGLTKRRSLSCVDGSVIKDKNNVPSSKDIYLKLFAFMSAASLSDTLAFVSELKSISDSSKSIYNKKNTILEISSVNQNGHNNDDSITLLASTSPIRSAAVNNSIDPELRTMNAIVVYAKDYTPQESGFVSYASRRGDNLEAILSADFASESDLHELIYLSMYKLCKHRYSYETQDEHKPFVVVINGNTGTLSIYDTDYLDVLFSQVSSKIKESMSKNTHLKSNIRVSTYVEQHLKEQNA